MAGRLIIPMALLLALLGGGCTPTTATQGYHDIRANWWSPSLEAKLPPTYRASDIAAAAEGALVRMGYTITERTDTEDRAIVVGEPAQSGPLDKIIVRASPSGRRFVVRITTRPVGDEDRARITLDEILVLLGL